MISRTSYGYSGSTKVCSHTNFPSHSSSGFNLLGFASGKLPSNKQVDVALTSFTNHGKLKTPNENLSEEGKVILQDFRNVVEEAKRLLLTKNYDESLQEFIWNTTQLGVKGGPETNTLDMPVSGESANRDAQEAKAGLRTLGELIITNG